MAFVPPPYPHDRLGPVRARRRRGARRDGRRLGRHAGRSRCPRSCCARSPMPRPAPPGTRRPSAVPRFRDAAVGWIDRRFGCTVTADEVVACIGTKELVASLPRALSLRDPSRDTVLYPAVAYPTYEMGALLAGLRAVPVPVDDAWHLDLARGRSGRRRRVRSCSGSTTRATRPVSTASPEADARTPSAGRGNAASSWPATSATPSSPTTPTAQPAAPVTALDAREPRACWWCTRCRSDRTWPACGPGSSPATVISSATWARCASTGA